MDRRAAVRRAAAAVLGGCRTGVRWARITRSSPSDRLELERRQPIGDARQRPAERPEPLGQPADPALRRERAHERHVGGDHQPAGGDQLAQRRAAAAGRCARADSPTSARRRACAVGRRRVRRDDAQHPAGPQQARAAGRSRPTGSSRCSSTSASTIASKLARRVAVGALAEGLQRQLAHVEAERVARAGRPRG